MDVERFLWAFATTFGVGVIILCIGLATPVVVNAVLSGIAFIRSARFAASLAKTGYVSWRAMLRRLGLTPEEAMHPFYPTQFYMVCFDADAMLVEATSPEEAVQLWNDSLIADESISEPLVPEQVFMLPAKSNTPRVVQWRGSIVDFDMQVVIDNQ